VVRGLEVKQVEMRGLVVTEYFIPRRSLKDVVDF
jgi:hypothetical protein